MKIISLFSHAHVVSNLYVDVLMLFKLLNKICYCFQQLVLYSQLL